MAITYFIIDELPSTYVPELGDQWIIASTWIKYIYNGTAWVQYGSTIFELEQANVLNISNFPSASEAFLIWNSLTALTSVPAGNLTLTRTFTFTDTSTVDCTVYIASLSPYITITLDGVQLITVPYEYSSSAYTSTWSVTPGQHTIVMNVTNSNTGPMWVAFALYDSTNSEIPYPVISDLNWIGTQLNGTGVSIENNINFTAPDNADALYPGWNSIGYMNPSWFPFIFPATSPLEINLINPTTAYLTFLFYYPICNQSFIFIA